MRMASPAFPLASWMIYPETSGNALESLLEA